MLQGNKQSTPFSAAKEGKANRPPMIMRAPVEDPRRTKRRRKHGRSSGKTSTKISSPPWSAKGLEALQRGLSSTRC